MRQEHESQNPTILYADTNNQLLELLTLITCAEKCFSDRMFALVLFLVQEHILRTPQHVIEFHTILLECKVLFTGEDFNGTEYWGDMAEAREYLRTQTMLRLGKPIEYPNIFEAAQLPTLSVPQMYTQIRTVET
jgi:hypothetical protein